MHAHICKMKRFADFSNFTKGLGYKRMSIYGSACAYMRIQGLRDTNFKQSLLQAHAPICEYITHHHILAHVLLSEGIRYIEKNI